MTYLLAVQTAAFAVVLWFVLRHVAVRDADATVVTTRLIETIERERDARRDEIQTLLQRIQAPERAVIAHAEQASGPPETGWPLSEEEAVEAQDARIAALAAIEELERQEQLDVRLPVP